MMSENELNSYKSEFIEKYGDRITTEQIQNNLNHMFYFLSIELCHTLDEDIDELERHAKIFL